MSYLTSLDWLHPVAMNVIERLVDVREMEALRQYCSIRSKCAYAPVNGEYIDLFNAVYNGIVYLKEQG
jgi:hypothetical protein